MLKFKSMGFEELVKVKARIDAEIELRAAGQRASLLEAMRSIRKLSSVRITSGSRQHKLKGKKLAPLYRNPRNRSETWAGRGNRPRWLVAALKQGKRLQSFAIK